MEQVLLVGIRVGIGEMLFHEKLRGNNEGGPGKTWSAQEFQTTLQTLRQVVLSWPDKIICYPGHGPSFRLGDKRKHIEAFLNKDHGGFFGDATWDM